MREHNVYPGYEQQKKTLLSHNPRHTVDKSNGVLRFSVMQKTLRGPLFENQEEMLVGTSYPHSKCFVLLQT